MKPITLFLVITAALVAAPIAGCVGLVILHEVTKPKIFDEDTPEWRRIKIMNGEIYRLDDYGRPHRKFDDYGREIQYDSHGRVIR